MNQTITRRKSGKKRRLSLIPVVILVVLALSCTFAVISDAPSRQEVSQLTLCDIDFSRLQDGTYTGAFTGKQGSLRDATVEIAVEGGLVSRIRILKGAIDENGAELELADGKSIRDVFNSVLAQKSLQVDSISGATLTCNAHLKALEQALLQAEQKQ
jgi:uncharacterized protein with FMN-binding domain